MEVTKVNLYKWERSSEHGTMTLENPPHFESTTRISTQTEAYDYFHPNIGRKQQANLVKQEKQPTGSSVVCSETTEETNLRSH